ncbi:MAG: hypothetical protein JWQ27_70 [Ferruginibacter sp.]|nr:hypothetical protein [Ferruginibacter sp.]
MSNETIFKRRKPMYKLLRKGYLFAFLFSFIIALGGIFQNHTFYKGNVLYHRDQKALLIAGIVMFIGSLIVTFLLVRWYYKKNDEENEFLRRKTRIMHDEISKPTYIFRFFFDYHGGGCLWSDNDAAYKKYGFGPLDGKTLDEQGNVQKDSRIKLSENLVQRVLELDNLFAESLNWENPGGDSAWDAIQWKSFYHASKELYADIARELPNDIQLLYAQRINGLAVDTPSP